MKESASEKLLADVAEQIADDPMSLSKLLYETMFFGFEIALATLDKTSLLSDRKFVAACQKNELAMALAAGDNSIRMLIHVLAEMADKHLTDKIRDDIIADLKEKGIQ